MRVRRLLCPATVLLLALVSATAITSALGGFPSTGSVLRVLPLSLLLVLVGTGIGVLGPRLNRAVPGLSEDFWREVATGFIAGSVISFVFGAVASDLDDRRQLEAERLENLAFVRDSLADPDGNRVFDEIDLGGQPLFGLHFTRPAGSRASGRPSLRGAKLAGADLRTAELGGASLLGADLRGADLRLADLSGVDLGRRTYCLPADETSQAADLSDAKLDGAILRGATITGAKLPGASLRYADLSQATLRDLDLRGVDLTGANLDGAVIVGSDLSTAELQGARLTDLGYVDTAWPPAMKPPQRREGGISGGGGGCI